MQRLFLSLLLSAGGSGSAKDAERPVVPSLPTYEVRRVTDAITVDGRLKEAAWQKATPIVLQFPWEKQTGLKQKTTVRLLWDSDYLYVAYQCEDTDIVAHYVARDDPTYEDDAVEIFVNPRPAVDTYVGLEMNARSVLYDYLYTFPQVLNKSHDLNHVKLAVQLDGTLNDSSDLDRGWSLELAIPFDNFAEWMDGRPISAGTVWMANLNRWDGRAPARRLSVWSDSGLVQPNPHQPKRFGRLMFVR